MGQLGSLFPSTQDEQPCERSSVGTSKREASSRGKKRGRSSSEENGRSEEAGEEPTIQGFGQQQAHHGSSSGAQGQGSRDMPTSSTNAGNVGSAHGMLSASAGTSHTQPTPHGQAHVPQQQQQQQLDANSPITSAPRLRQPAGSLLTRIAALQQQQQQQQQQHKVADVLHHQNAAAQPAEAHPRRPTQGDNSDGDLDDLPRRPASSNVNSNRAAGTGSGKSSGKSSGNGSRARAANAGSSESEGDLDDVPRRPGKSTQQQQQQQPQQQRAHAVAPPQIVRKRGVPPRAPPPPPSRLTPSPTVLLTPASAAHVTAATTSAVPLLACTPASPTHHASLQPVLSPPHAGLSSHPLFLGAHATTGASTSTSTTTTSSSSSSVSASCAGAGAHAACWHSCCPAGVVCEGAPRTHDHAHAPNTHPGHTHAPMHVLLLHAPHARAPVPTNLAARTTQHPTPPHTTLSPATDTYTPHVPAHALHVPPHAPHDTVRAPHVCAQPGTSVVLSPFGSPQLQQHEDSNSGGSGGWGGGGSGGEQQQPQGQGQGLAGQGQQGSLQLGRRTTAPEAVEHDIAPEATVESSDVDEDEYMDFDPIQFIKSLPPLSQVVPSMRSFLLPCKTQQSQQKTLVLDLDETLVHSSLETPAEACDFRFPVFFSNQEHMINVRCRPHLREFMERVSQLFEVVVFTASQKIYAERLLDILDPMRTLIKHRIYRDACVVVEGNYLKDLSVLGRDLRDTFIIDNSPQAFGFQVDNGIPIESWYSDDADTELLQLLPFLEELAKAEDVRPAIAARFKLRQLIDAAPLLE